MFWYDFGNNFLFHTISSFYSDSLLLLNNLLSRLFRLYLRYIFFLCYQLLKWTLFWFINSTKLIVRECEEWYKSIRGRNGKNLIIFPRQISECCKVEVTHSIKWFHCVSIVNKNAVCCSNSKNHVIWLLEKSFLGILFFEKNRTKFTY